MAAKGKNIRIDISSSSSSDVNGDEDDSSSDIASISSGDECELIDDEESDDVYEVDDDEAEKDEEEDEFLNDDGHGVEDDDDDDDHSLSDRVIRFLQGRRDLQELSLKACKAYLRSHGLRVSGNKDECVGRVQEHWRIKDGKAEALYPTTSFVINCTGDVCKGDTVLFKQKVYGSFDKVTRNGKVMGIRTVAGRVVKESYGAAKQQHTFTVEVLWSKGIKKLPPLFPLLVKGRNLYKLKTYRKPWKNEGDRRKALAEKHKRGTVARYRRAKRKKALSTNKGVKSWKGSHCERPSQMSYPVGGKHFGTEKGISSSTKQQRNVKQGAARNSTRAKFSKTLRSQKPVFGDARVATLQPYHGPQKYSDSQVGPYHRSVPFGSHPAEFQSGIPYQGPMMMPAEQPGISSHYHFPNFNNIQSPSETHMHSRPIFPSRAPRERWINGHLSCSNRGCNASGSNTCVISACWRCCRRAGMGCNVHR